MLLLLDQVQLDNDAIYAARANSNLFLSGIQPGGQLTITTDAENYPGYENPIQGPLLMDQCKTIIVSWYFDYQ